MSKRQQVAGFLPPNRVPWTDEPFKVPPGRLPRRGPRGTGNISRAAEIIWRRLHARLDAPIFAQRSRERTRLWVLDVWYFDVDRERRMLTSGLVGRDGVLDAAHAFDLEYPLLGMDLEGLADRILWRWPYEEKVSVPYDNGYPKACRLVMACVQSRLASDPRYRALAESTLVRELALDRTVHRLARKACSWRSHPDSSEYQLVWRNQEAFHEASVANARLMPLLLFMLQGAADRLRHDPLAQLKQWFRRRGMDETAWRFVAATQPATWTPLWRGLEPGSRLHGTLRFVKLLGKVGFDMPLDGPVTVAWLDAIAGAAPFLSMDQDWDIVHPSVLRAAYRASDEIVAARAQWGRAGDVRAVLQWAARERIRLDNSQSSAAWQALQGRYWDETARGTVRTPPVREPPPRRGEFPAVIGSDNHYLVHKVGAAMAQPDGGLRFIGEDGYGNADGSIALRCPRSLLRSSGLASLDDVRYVVAYHCGWGIFPRCLLKSLRDIPAQYYGPGGMASSRLAGHLEVEMRTGQS